MHFFSVAIIAPPIENRHFSIHCARLVHNTHLTRTWTHRNKNEKILVAHLASKSNWAQTLAPHFHAVVALGWCRCVYCKTMRLAIASHAAATMQTDMETTRVLVNGRRRARLVYALISILFLAARSESMSPKRYLQKSLMEADEL